MEIRLSKLILAASLGLFAVTFAVATPIALDPSAGLVAKSAFAKNGADDPAGDDRGGNSGSGGSGRGGADDPAGHD